MIWLSDRSRGGFTLIELLVVLTVISLLLVLVPNLTAGVSGVRFRAAARAVAADLRMMQATARGSGREITVTIDTRARSWRSSLDGREHDLPAGIDTLQVRFLRPAASRPMLHFLPDGSATVAVLALTGAGRHAEITIEGLDGKVRLDD